MRAVWALAVAVVVAASAVVAVRLAPPGPEAAPASYPLPEPGTVEPIVGPQNAPAFLARDLDGTTRAFLGVAPHSGLPLAWCPDEQVFVEPVGASRFDLAGRYGFGPAPHGLRPFEVEVQGDRALLRALQGPPPRSQEARTQTVPGMACLGSEGYVLGVLPPTAQLPGPLTPAGALSRQGWVTVRGTLEERADGVLLCAATVGRCPPSSLGVAAVLEGYAAQRSEPRRGTYLALIEGGALSALVSPVGAEDVDYEDTLDAGADSWCGQGTLTEMRERFEGERRVIDVVIADVGPPTSPAHRCGYATPPAPEAVRGRTVTLPASAYAAEYTVRLAFDALTVFTGGPIPAQGSPELPSSDGLVDARELATALGLDVPVAGVVQVHDGQLTDLWIPPP